MEHMADDKKHRFFDDKVDIVKYKVAELADENARLKEDLEKSEERLAKAKTEISLKDEQLKRLRHVHARYISRLEGGQDVSISSPLPYQLEASIQEILNSTSWRVTKPLRWLKTRLRGR